MPVKKFTEPFVAYDLKNEDSLTNNVQEPSAVVLDGDAGFELYFIGLGLRFPK